ncbi:hypothetical protein MTO96_036620 [Rhipicephalus appendiculatus]
MKRRRTGGGFVPSTHLRLSSGGGHCLDTSWLIRQPRPWARLHCALYPVVSRVCDSHRTFYCWLARKAAVHYRAIRSVGIVLITVSGIAWRLTSHEAPSCRAMLGLRGDEPGGRRFVPRVPPYGGQARGDTHTQVGMHAAPGVR